MILNTGLPTTPEFIRMGFDPIRSIAISEDNTLTYVEQVVRGGDGEIKQTLKFLAFKGQEDALKKLELITNARYSKTINCLLLPFLKETIQTVETLVRIDTTSKRYKEERAKALSFPQFRPYYPSLSTNLYTGETQPEAFQHQVDNLAFCLSLFKKIGKTGFFLADEMGTGKSRTTTDLTRFFSKRNVLIISQKIAVGQWVESFADAGFDKAYLHPLEGTIEDKKKFLNGRTKTLTQVANNNEYNYYFVNWDIIYNLKEVLSLFEFDLIICDEGHRMKDRKTKIAKAMVELGDISMRQGGHRVVLTGTPYGGDPGDIWMLFRFLAPEIFGKSYWKFSQRYFILGGFTGNQFLDFRPEYLTEFIQNFFTLTRRTTKAGSLDMPPKTFRVVKLQPSVMQRKAYKALVDELYIEQRTSPDTIARVDIVNALSRTLKLQQVTSGILPIRTSLQFDQEYIERRISRGENIDMIADLHEQFDDYVIGNDGTVNFILGGTKTDWLVEELKSKIEDDPEAKFIVWTNFRQEIGYVTGKLRTNLSDSTSSETINDPGSFLVERIDGGTSQKVREAIRVEYNKRNSKLRVLVCNIKAGAYSLDLKLADHLYYHSNTFNYRDRLQSEDRGHRLGRTKPYNITDLVMSNTVDIELMAAYRRKKNLADMIMGDANFERRVAMMEGM